MRIITIKKAGFPLLGKKQYIHDNNKNLCDVKCIQILMSMTDRNVQSLKYGNLVLFLIKDVRKKSADFVLQHYKKNYLDRSLSEIV